MKAVIKAIELLSKLPVYWTVNGKYYRGFYNAMQLDHRNRTFGTVQISEQEYLEATKDSINVKEAARGLIRASLTGK